jgi:hypothetical protein
MTPTVVGSTGGAPRLTGIAAGYVGNGRFDLGDADQGDPLATFTIYTVSDPFPSTLVLDVTNFIRARLLAGDHFAAFNLRIAGFPPVPHSVRNAYTSHILTFTLIPEPSAALVLALAAATGGLRRRPLA